MRKIGYVIAPGIGGTSTFFDVLRRSLTKFGWELYGLCTKPIDGLEPTVVRDFVRFHNGVIIEGDSPVRKSEGLIEICKRMELFGLLLTDDRIGTATIPHLPDHVRVIARSSGIKPIGYKLDVYYKSFVEAFVATSLRQQRDLENRYRVEKEKLWLIPHGVEDFLAGPEIKYRRSDQGLLNLAYVGRLIDRGKGVLLLPKILKETVKINENIQLHIVGSGIDEQKLKKEIQKNSLDRFCIFHGNKSRQELRNILALCDILLVPSYYEGFGISIIEAMSSGILPLASKIRDVTDWIIKDGFSGILCKIGDTIDFANKIKYLNKNRGILEEMKLNAREEFLARFTDAQMAAKYHKMLTALEGKQYLKKEKGLSQFNSSLCRIPSYRKYVPNRIVNLYSKLQFRK